MTRTNQLTNNQILLSERVDQEFKESSGYSDKNSFFEHFAISELLKNYNVTDDEIDNGNTGGGNDGGCDGIYLFLNDELIVSDQIEKADSNVSVVHSRDNPTYMRIELCDCDKLKSTELQKVYSEKLLTIISTVVSVMLRDNTDFIKLKQLVEQEETIVGIELFATSLFYGYATLGSNAFDYSYLTSEFEEVPLLRTKKVELKEHDNSVIQDVSEERIIYDQRIGYGYRNDDYFFILIRYISLPNNFMLIPRIS